MAYAEAKKFDADLIPIVDITTLRDGSDPVRVAHALHRASQNLGFIYINGHGIPEAAIHAARACALTFFRSDTAQKAAVTVSPHHRGWLGRNGARMQDDAKADLKESFIWGRESAAGVAADDHPLRGPNQWPDFVPGMQQASMEYFEKVHEVAQHLMRGFALGLGLDEGFFLRTAAAPLSRASYVYYPNQDEDLGEDQFGVGPHTDFGVLTVLCQDALGGLQVEDLNGDWVHAPPIAGTLVVNVGDLLSRWTDGAYRSTPHRVVNNSGQERLSLVLAFDPDPGTMIDAREVCGSNHEPAEDAITCGDYLVWRFKKAFSYR
jgi:isopenicillin N synthase-like dioxygenase